MEKARSILSSKIAEWLQLAEQLNWQSYDPMDFLLSPYFKDVQRISSFAARVLVQSGMRSGSRIRRILKIPPHEEAKTLSDYLSAAVILMKADQPGAEYYVRLLTEKLQCKAIPSPLASRCGWGLEFPYSTRFVNAATRTPNIYQTTNALHSFLDCYDVTGDETFLRTLMKGVRFINEDLGCYLTGGYLWFRYFASGSYPVINIQASLASLYARIGKILNSWQYLDLADRLAYTVISVQQPDGSWPYSYGSKAKFIDGFHTGFILQGLKEYSCQRGSQAQTDTYLPLKKGFDFYIHHLLLPGGLPRYYADGPFKPDGQNIAQCIQVLVTCSDAPEHYDLAWQVWWNMFNYLNLGQPGGRPEKESSNLFSRRYIQLRWTVAPVVLATAHLFAKTTEMVPSAE